MSSTPFFRGDPSAHSMHTLYNKQRRKWSSARGRCVRRPSMAVGKQDYKRERHGGTRPRAQLTRTARGRPHTAQSTDRSAHTMLMHAIRQRKHGGRWRSHRCTRPATWQASVTLQWRGTRVLQQQASRRSWQPSPRSRPRCYRQRARALPMHVRLEPARLHSRAVRG